MLIGSLFLIIYLIILCAHRPYYLFVVANEEIPHYLFVVANEEIQHYLFVVANGEIPHYLFVVVNGDYEHIARRLYYLFVTANSLIRATSI